MHMTTPTRHIIWNMTRKCNFSCHYCYFPHDNSPVTETLPIESLLNFMDAQGGEWLVGLTGGEPFIYPDFVNICARLTERHIIGVDTNLSVSSRIAEFAKTIDPKRVHDIYASLHIEERRKRKGVDAFIRNYHTLKERDFRIIVNYVVHPSLTTQFLEDRKFLAAQGVTIVPRPFKGRIDGRKYPEAYNDEAKAIFSEYTEAGTKMVFNFRGVPCHGGYTFLRLEPDGTVFRCPGDRTDMGSVGGNVQLEKGLTPCKVDRCPCQGVHYVKMTEAQEQFVEGMRNVVTGNLSAARKAFSKATDHDPTHSAALNNLGVLAAIAKDTERAREFFDKARAQHPHIALYGRNADCLTSATCTADALEYCDIVAPDKTIG